MSRTARVVLAATFSAAVANLGCSGEGSCFTAFCHALGDGTSGSATTGSTTEPTTGSTGPDGCGNGVIDEGEACDDGVDCADSVCNSDVYTGKQHCRADCSGQYGEYCGNAKKDGPPGEEQCDRGGNAIDCDADCTLPTCGDMIFNPVAEECDDSNSVETDACVMCKQAFCGDGYVQGGMEACDDGNQDNSDSCTNECKSATCGDGYIQPGEVCDEGPDNADNAYDGCTETCLPGPRCGDGVVQADKETCDDGNQVDDDACSNECVESRRVFVTGSGGEEGTFKGNLGGLAGADAKCSAAAMAAALSGTWKAWLSDDTGSPSTRFDTSFKGWYRLVDGTPVAKGWAGLTTQPLKSPINLTETGATPVDPMQAWSNTTSLGTKASTTHCNNWSTSQLAPKGRLGDATATTSDWTNLSDLNLNPLTCGASLHLYCVEDP